MSKDLLRIWERRRASSVHTVLHGFVFHKGLCEAEGKYCATLLDIKMLQQIAAWDMHTRESNSGYARDIKWLIMHFVFNSSGTVLKDYATFWSDLVSQVA